MRIHKLHVNTLEVTNVDAVRAILDDYCSNVEFDIISRDDKHYLQSRSQDNPYSTSNRPLAIRKTTRRLLGSALDVALKKRGDSGFMQMLRRLVPHVTSPFSIDAAIFFSPDAKTPFYSQHWFVKANQRTVRYLAMGNLEGEEEE